MLYTDYQGKEINLSPERWKHINNKHPETMHQEKIVNDTITDPDYIQEGSRGEKLSIKKFAKTPVSENKYCIVVYKNISLDKGFILTVYFTRRPSFKRKIIWKK
ncbi:MAG: hypothetical protein V1874_04905 [Spirochaetota bacterium]